MLSQVCVKNSVHRGYMSGRGGMRGRGTGVVGGVHGKGHA